MIRSTRSLEVYHQFSSDKTTTFHKTFFFEIETLLAQNSKESCLFQFHAFKSVKTSEFDRFHSLDLITEFFDKHGILRLHEKI